MRLPNDVAIAPDGMLYASDPDWATSTGQVWRINDKGHISLAADNMAPTLLQVKFLPMFAAPFIHIKHL